MDPPHMAEKKQDNQLEHTYSSYVRIRDVAMKTCRRRWTIGRSGERGSRIPVLAARHDDDDGLSLEVSFSWVFFMINFISLYIMNSPYICFFYPKGKFHPWVVPLFCWLSIVLLFLARLGILSVSQNRRELFAAHSPGLIPSCAYTTCSYGQI